MERTTAEYAGGREPVARRPLGRTVDWLVALLLALVGAGVATVGTALFGLGDRALVADLVAEGAITSTELTDAQLVETTVAVARWGGLGLALSGALVVAGAVGYLYTRSRSRRAYAETGRPRRDDFGDAVTGAVVTYVLSFVPLSPILGGASAGYLGGGDRRVAVRAGALSGLFATVPLAVALGAVAVGVATTAVPVNLFVAGLLLVSTAVVVLYFVGLGAVGGFIAAALDDRERASERDREDERGLADDHGRASERPGDRSGEASRARREGDHRVESVAAVGERPDDAEPEEGS
jgi:hypothetical protein